MQLFQWQKEFFLDSNSKYNVLPAGRRSGKTQGAERAAIINASQAERILWIDTVNANIDRYVERYFLADLRPSGLTYRWKAQQRTLKIEGGYIDFRSADKPENIEGFGYHKIYLNEAGIILNNDYLYINSVLPMLLDYEGSQLFAFGTPKGQTNKEGKPHRFYTLYQKALTDDKKYNGFCLSTYSNPILTEQDIQDLESEMLDQGGTEAVQQELHAKFIADSEEKVFNEGDLEKFKIGSLRDDTVFARVGGIDVADEGVDSLSFPIAYLAGSKVYIVDWYFTKDNTEITLPTSASLTRHHGLNHLAVETNNHGSIFFKNIFRQVRGTQLIGVNQKHNKHSRIINSAHFIRTRFVFRDDYLPGSDYDKAMTELFAYRKDAKVKFDDAPDSLALLTALIRDLYPHIHA